MWYFLSAISHTRSNIFTIISTLRTSKCLPKTSVLLRFICCSCIFFPKTLLIFWVQNQKIRPLLSSLTQSTVFLLWRTDSAMTAKYTVKLLPLYTYLCLWYLSNRKYEKAVCSTKQNKGQSTGPSWISPLPWSWITEWRWRLHLWVPQFLKL